MFRSKLVLEADDTPGQWIVRVPLLWSDVVYGDIEVPAGTRTDLASIPRALRNLPSLDPQAHSRRPAVVHDYLYSTQTVTRAIADRFLLDAMQAEGATFRARWMFYYGVRAGGWLPWKRHAERRTRCPHCAGSDCVECNGR